MPVGRLLILWGDSRENGWGSGKRNTGTEGKPISGCVIGLTTTVGDWGFPPGTRWEFQNYPPKWWKKGSICLLLPWSAVTLFLGLPMPDNWMGPCRHLTPVSENARAKSLRLTVGLRPSAVRVNLQAHCCRNRWNWSHLRGCEASKRGEGYTLPELMASPFHTSYHC